MALELGVLRDLEGVGNGEADDVDGEELGDFNGVLLGLERVFLWFDIWDWE